MLEVSTIVADEEHDDVREEDDEGNLSELVASLMDEDVF